MEKIKDINLNLTVNSRKAENFSDKNYFEINFEKGSQLLFRINIMHIRKFKIPQNRDSVCYFFQVSELALLHFLEHSLL